LTFSEKKKKIIKKNIFEITQKHFERPLTVRIEEHKIAVSKGKTHKSKLAEHISSANGDHIPQVKIIDRERFWKERKLKEAVHIILSPTCMSQNSADFNPMWLPLLMKGNN